MATNPENDRITHSSMAYTELGIDIRFVHALWHISRVSHLTEKELEGVYGTFGLSSADINVLGAIWNAASGTLRATDMAEMLRVSNAVLSPRIAKLQHKGLVEKRPSKTDRRAVEIRLTARGAEIIESAIKAISTDSKFVRHFLDLPKEDQNDLLRILNKLHSEMLRDFSPRSR